MGMELRRILHGKKRYLPLLLLGDEQEDMIDRYLDRGELWVLQEDGVPRAVCVVTDEGGGVFEIKNLAVDPAFQRRGLGKQLVNALCRRCARRGHTMLVGTGETPGTLRFYARCGFVPSHRIPDFFTRHYDHPIVEEGVTLRDMIYLKRALEEPPYER